MQKKEELPAAEHHEPPTEVPKEETERIKKAEAYDQIREDHERLRALAEKEQKSIAAFLDGIEQAQKQTKMERLTEECGGNGELAERIFALEQSQEKDPGLAELAAAFPQFDSEEKLPQGVAESARLHGNRLLDAYLRYLLQQKRDTEAAEKTAKAAEGSSVGTLRRHGAAQDPADAEFLRGLWGR